MQTLVATAFRCAKLLMARNETISVAESSAGGLISASLLAVPGASSYFMGGDIIYTAQSRAAFGISAEMMANIRASTEPYARLLASTAKARLGTIWAIGESGASGPNGNRYGDAPGHACIAISGPINRSMTLNTGHSDRESNMRAFAWAAFTMLEDVLKQL